MIVVDTGFFSSLHKINQLNLILKAFDTYFVVIPTQVYNELKKSPSLEVEKLCVFSKNEVTEKKFVIVEDAEINNELFTEPELSSLGCGELACICLAKKQRGNIFLIDDRRAAQVAKSKKLKVVSLPAFLMYCKGNQIVSKSEIVNIIDLLKEKDFYEFTEEVKEELLR